MATNYTQIGLTANVGSGGASSISFTSIPNTYTDLIVKISTRWDSNSDGFSYIRFNGDSGNNYSYKVLYGDPQTPSAGSVSASGTDKSISGGSQWASWTSNVFGSIEVYIPNYVGSAYKTFSGDGFGENNATQTYPILSAGYWNSTSAITSITLLQASGAFVQYSTASLYGILKS